MKRFILLTGIAASALALSACADDHYRGRVALGWEQPYAYDGYYDGYYGQIHDGYWGDDGSFYYRSGDGEREYHRGDGDHFRRENNGEGRYQHFQGSIQTRPEGARMPHFGLDSRRRH